jgi:hypothetical protein
MAYLDTITYKIPQNFDANFTEWMVFLRDHITNLRKEAQIISLDAYQQRLIKYRPELILQEYHFPIALTYIFLLVNYLSCPMEVINLDTIYIPDEQKINTLYLDYTLDQKAKELRKTTKIK